MTVTADAAQALGAQASERFPAAAATIAVFTGQLARATGAGDPAAVAALLERFEDYLEALLVAPRR
jgi:hypothetical protein